MEELRALAERANSWGKRKAATHTQTQSPACRQGELAATTECPRRAGAPGSSSRTATHPGCRQGLDAWRTESRRQTEEGHWAGRAPASPAVPRWFWHWQFSPKLVTAFCRMPAMEGKSVPFTSTSCCSPGALPGCFFPHYTKSSSGSFQGCRASVTISNELCTVGEPLFSACLLSGPFLSPPV